ncbi:MAG: YdeI/OmpD-associated family protein [Candidatus Thermoplasmatota archaeon]|nr:YdeI/OmpD-associated family protein [Candidatus Thermoplasmatota archaeon]
MCPLVDKDQRPVPAELSRAIEKDDDAIGAWNSMPRSHQRDYVRWVRDVNGDAREERASEAVLLIKDWRKKHCR